MSHDIVKRGSKRYECTVCGQEWTFPSKAHCPGMKVIAYADRGALMSKTELDKRGYKASGLPKSECCYRMTTAQIDVLYVKLYDPAKCTRKKERKHKLVHYVDVLHWPVAWMSFLESLGTWHEDHRNEYGALTWERRHEWQEKCLEMARMASALLAFTPEDISQLHEETIEFQFPLTAIRTHWQDHGLALAQAEQLIELLLSRYREYKWRNRPPLTEEEWEQIRLKTEAYEREQQAIRDERRAKLFEGITRMTPDEDLPPAVQRSLFNGAEA